MDLRCAGVEEPALPAVDRGTRRRVTLERRDRDDRFATTSRCVPGSDVPGSWLHGQAPGVSQHARCGSAPSGVGRRSHRAHQVSVSELLDGATVRAPRKREVSRKPPCRAPPLSLRLDNVAS